MAKRKIVWTLFAKEDLQEILAYWTARNGNTKYSRTLSKQIRESVKIIGKHPFIGRVTDEENIRVVISGNYLIFYELTTKFIIIHQIWDSRQNPESRIV